MPGLTQPTAAQITANQNRIYPGVRLTAEGKPLHLWESGLNEEQFWKVITFKYGVINQDFLYTYLTLLKGEFSPVAGQRFSWSEMGRIRKGVEVESLVNAVGGATITIETPNTEILVRPSWRLNSAAGNQQFNVDSVALVGGKEQITLSKIDGTNFAAADIAATDFLGMSNPAFAENTGQPQGMNWTPERKHQKLTLMKETYAVSGDALTQEADVLLSNNGVALWAHAEEIFTVMNHKYDVASALAWSQESADDAQVYSSRGIFRDMLANSIQTPYLGTLDEAELQDALLAMNGAHSNEDWMGMSGDLALRDIQNGLKDYVVDGGVFYGNFSSKQGLALGLNINQYSFMGKVLNFKEYKGLNDRHQTGQTAGAASATNIDYRQSIFFLNQGIAPSYNGEGGGSYVSFKYKAFNGINRSMAVAFRPGMTGRVSLVNGMGLQQLDATAGNELLQRAQIPVVTTDVDRDEFYFLSQVAPCIKDIENAHFVMRRVG